MFNILVVYYSKGEHPLRKTITDHLYSFQRYSKHKCFYLNLAVRRVPTHIRNLKLDLVIFHTIFLSTRWNRADFERVLQKASALKHVDAVKIALPQDEFLNTDLLGDFINEFQIDYVFSVAPESEWEKIYPTVDRKRVRFVNVLTGYLDDDTLNKIDRLVASVRERPIDIGYRAWRGAAWLGRHGVLKAQIADLFHERAANRGLVLDVSTRVEDTFLGEAWYDFLLRCKYMIGVEGGASILDWDGTIRQRTDAFVKAYPEASFTEIEANCFPNLDGSLRLFAISPRHLEACATRTCQVLVEGAYNGILVSGQHYIPLKRDFSNIEQVLDLIKRDSVRKEITERAYRDVVESEQCTYRNFVDLVFTQVFDSSTSASSAQEGLRNRLTFAWLRMADSLSWVIVMLNWYAVILVKRRIRKILVSISSEEIVSSLLHWLRGMTET
jgi:hypothetical protein